MDNRITKKIARSTLYIVLSFLIPLLGWGFDDVRGYCREPSRAVCTLSRAGMFAILGVMLDHPFKKGVEGKEVKSQTAFSMFGLVLAVLLGVTASYSDRREIGTMRESKFLRYLGLLLLNLGQTLEIVSIRTMGDEYSIRVTLQEDHRLVREGIYRYLRHPQYLGTLITMAGYGLVFRSRPIIYLVGPTMLLLLPRMNTEEELLESRFGDEWREYRGSSWRLIPHVYLQSSPKTPSFR